MSDLVNSSISPLTNPANPDQQIRMREATCAEAMSFSGLNPLMEEAALTEFLNKVQESEHYSNARFWTAQTRNVAFFWYALHTMSDSGMSTEYTCEHCGEVHTLDFDLRSLADNFQMISGKPERDFQFAGQTIRVKPLTGEAMEDLEQMRLKLQRDKKSNVLDNDYNRAERAKIRLQFLLWAIDYPNDLTEDKADRWQIKRNKVTELSHTQYEKLKDQVYSALGEMSHGLNAVLDDEDGLQLVAGMHVCPTRKKEGVTATTQLHIPFRSVCRIPVV